MAQLWVEYVAVRMVRSPRLHGSAHRQWHALDAGQPTAARDAAQRSRRPRGWRRDLRRQAASALCLSWSYSPWSIAPESSRRLAFAISVVAPSAVATSLMWR